MTARARFQAGTATRLAFLVVGLGTAAWAPLVPEAKLRLGLAEGELGLVLLALGGGAVLAMPASGLAIRRFGIRAVMLAGGLLFCAALPALALAPSAWMLALALAAFGAGLGTTDVAMNAQAVVVEKRAGRAMMSGFHGLFSAGGLGGAGVVSLLLALGLTPAACTWAMAAAMTAILLSQAAAFLPRAASPPPAAAFALPHGRLVLIGLLCAIAFLAEGVVLDWSAVLLRFWREATPATAGLGYAVFSAAMVAGRLTGDAVVRRFRPAPVLRWGAGLAALGFLVLTALPSVATGLAGCVLIGLGAANIVPVLFSAAGRLPGADPGTAMAAAATPGYAGLLAGPALVGGLAQMFGLPVAIALVGALLLIVILRADIADSERTAA